MGSVSGGFFFSKSGLFSELSQVFILSADVLKLKTLKGLALVDILQLVHTYVQRSECIV